MIADITIQEKSFGDKDLMHDVRFHVDAEEKVGLIGRNGVGKTTLFSILTKQDTDYTGSIIYKRGLTVVATAQEHHVDVDMTVMEYVLQGLPEYSELMNIIRTYPQTMGDNMRMINEYTDALQRFDDKGYYSIEEQIERELSQFQLAGVAKRPLSSLSGGQKRLVEVVKVMHSSAHIALIDEPTNHMDYVAKQQFIDWMKSAKEAMIVITHDRDVLQQVDRIVELKDGTCQSFKGNYDAYLKQNAVHTGAAMNEFELVERRIVNLKAKVIDYKRLKEKARNPATIQKFKRLELNSRKELAELQEKEKPTFWIDKESVQELNHKTAGQYEKFKARNIRMNVKSNSSRSKRVLVDVKNLALGYGEKILFEGVNIDLREGEAIEIRGRNGAGKTTLIKALLGQPGPVVFDGQIALDQQARIGIYEQEVSREYFSLTLPEAIEKIYLSRDLSISDAKIRQLMSNYLFTEADMNTPVERLSGGQKARLQIIAMLANDPDLLILDEPTNHLDLPSIEELETALQKYSGAILFVSHDGYFTQKIQSETVVIGA